MNVVFFPRNDYPNNIEVCAHRLGKKMTYTDCTDQLKFNVSYDWIVGYAKQLGIKLSFFGYYAEFLAAAFNTKAIPDLENGDIWVDVYSYAPNIASKITGGGTITQEEWNTAYNDYLCKNYFMALGKKPIALSYSYNHYSDIQDYITQFLGGRRSGYDRNVTSYGLGQGEPNNVPYSFNAQKALTPTFEWWDEVKYGSSSITFAEEIEIVADKIDAALLNGGWIRNFTHYHSVYDDDTQPYEDYLDMLATKNVNSEIYFAGYGEALAYLVFRQIITKVAMYSPIGAENDKLIIRLETKNNLSIDTDLLQIPISVKFSTAGTPLEGQNIKCSHNLISLGNNQYIVEIPYYQYPAAIIEKVSI